MKAEKEKLEQMKRDLRWECFKASSHTNDDWYRKVSEKLKSPPPKIISKKEAASQLRRIQRLENKLKTKK